MNRFSVSVLRVSCAVLLGFGTQVHAQNPNTASSTKATVQAPEKLSNGVQWVSSVDRIAPRVAISLLLRVGAADETLESAGWRRLVVGAMLRSAPKGFESAATGRPETEALTRAAERLGGSIGASVGDDTIEIFATGNSARGTELLKLMLALAQNPRLSDADIDAARTRLGEGIDAEEFDIAGRVGGVLRGQLFRNGSGEFVAYGLPENGTRESLASLTNERVRELFASRVSRASVTVAAAGDVDESGMRALLNDFRAPGATPMIEAPAPIFATPRGATPLVVRELPTPAAWVFVSYGMGTVDKRDVPALRVLASALGEARGARLPTRLLQAPLGAETPAALATSAQWIPRRYAGELLISAQTSPQGVDNVKNLLLDEVRKLREGSLKPVELERARAYARGAWSLERQNLRDRAFLTALSPALGGSSDASLAGQLENVSAADVKRVATKYLNNYAVALVMPREMGG